MHSYIRVYFILMLVMLLCVSCEKSQVTHNDMCLISALLPDSESDSKVSFIDKPSSLDLYWEDDDCIWVSGTTTEKYMIESYDGKSAKFKGNYVSGDSFDVVLSCSADYQNRRYEGQVQSTVLSSDHLEYDACLKGVTSYNDVSFTQEWAQSHGGNLRQNGCLMLHLKLPQEIDAITRLTLAAPEEIFYMTNSTSGEMSSELSLEFEDGTLQSDKIVKAYMMTSVQESLIEDGMALCLTVETPIGKFSKTFTPGRVVLLSGKRNVIRLNAKGWMYDPGFEYVSVRLMSYNIAAFKKYKSELGHYSYQEAADIIHHHDIDIVGLNETDNGYNRTDYHYQAQKLASELGSDWTYYFAYAANECYGNSIVASPTCKIVKEWPSLIIPKGSGLEQRSMGAIEYEDFVFCVTHFDYMNSDVMISGADIVTDWALEHYGKTMKPVFLVGDLNCTPDHEAIARMKENWTMLSTEEFTFPCPGPRTKCIDYIFILNNGVEYQLLDYDVLTSSTSTDLSLISDHYPIYAEVRFKIPRTFGQLEDFMDNSIYVEP